jgi:hypothetical protein
MSDIFFRLYLHQKDAFEAVLRQLPLAQVIQLADAMPGIFNLVFRRNFFHRNLRAAVSAACKANACRVLARLLEIPGATFFMDDICARPANDATKVLIRGGKHNVDGRIIRHFVKTNQVEHLELLLQDPRINMANVMWHLISTYYSLRKERPKDWNGHPEVLELLLKDGRADPAIYNNLLLREAAAEGHVEIVKMLLLDPRVDPTASSPENMTALDWAKKYHHTEVVELLENFFKK